MSPLAACRPLLFVGPTGTGKTVYVQQKLMSDLSKDHFVPMFISFSARTTANHTQVVYLLRAIDGFARSTDRAARSVDRAARSIDSAVPSAYQ